MSYLFKEQCCKEFVLRIKDKKLDDLDIPAVIVEMQKELQKTIIQYVNAKVLK